MVKKILGLDLGSNSIGWALMEEKNGKASKIIDIGSRIFNKAVKEETPTPKNQKRREMRLGRRVLQRRAQRRQKMLNYLVSLDLLPRELQGNNQPEKLLNKIGDPYQLRTEALDEQLSPHQLGRILLHFVARRGFLSNKKQMAGDLVDDPDTIDYLRELDKKPDEDKDEGDFKKDIAEVYEDIEKAGARTLGEYLYKREKGECKRNRSHAGGHLRTDRAMYQDELAKIWQKQAPYFANLPADFMSDNNGIKRIIFYQRPLKLKKDRVGKCSLEPRNYRANTARLEAQRFRYLQDINHLAYSDELLRLSDAQKMTLRAYFQFHPTITLTKMKKELGLDKFTKINLEAKDLKGNTTACKIRKVLGEQWDEMNDSKQKELFEDLFSIRKKSALKNRLISHWSFDIQTAVKLCLIEFEPGHSNLSLKAINKLLPYLEKGMIYSDARQAAGYDYAEKDIIIREKLPIPPETANPIVNKGLHELRRVVNAIIKEYGNPDAIRIEMARDLEMNTKRYRKYMDQTKKNENANKEAQKEFQKLELGKEYASRDQAIKFRLWKDQDGRCAYSVRNISLEQVFSADTETDHILPFKKSLDNSYMNKVICFTAENRDKGDKTPIDKWGGDDEKWTQITQSISRWDKSLKSKVERFYQTENDLQNRDFIESQLNDTRYISRLAKDYMRQLGGDVSITKGVVVSEIRHQWGFNTLLGETDKKERTDHRHHAIDAVVIAATSRSLYQKAVKQIKQDTLTIEPPYSNIRNELNDKLKHVIVSHAPQRKLSGGLHEETGAGYIEKHGGLVYRKILNEQLNPSKIVDETVKDIVLEHISNYKTPKEAFSNNITVFHKDGKTPIKRVRVLQSKITKKELMEKKFGVKDKSEKIFKWMTFGNTHHVEIIRHKETGKIKGEFVTMMEAHRRAMTGTNSAIKRNVIREEIVKTDHGEEYKFEMVLHINDMVSIMNEDGERNYYRVQNLNKEGKIKITFHADAHEAKKIPKDKTIHKAVTTLMSDKYKLKKHRLNVIGYPIND